MSLCFKRLKDDYHNVLRSSTVTVSFIPRICLIPHNTACDAVSDNLYPPTQQF